MVAFLLDVGLKLHTLGWRAAHGALPRKGDDVWPPVMDETLCRCRVAKDHDFVVKEYL